MGVGTSAVVGGEKTLPKQERLGGARADFVANLGRRGAEITAMLDALDADPQARVRDDLRRRLHALAAGARLLHFRELAESLVEAEGRLESAAQRGMVSDEDREVLRGLVQSMPELAWSQVSQLEERSSALPEESVISEDARLTKLRATQEPIDAPPVLPTTVLVVGAAALADALSAPISESDDRSLLPGAFEVERTEDLTVAIDMGRALAPDVVVLDADRDGSRQLVEALLADPLTEPIPLVIVGGFRKPEDAGPFLALGVAKALPKPVSPGGLRRACIDVTSAYVRGESSREPLGELDVDQLGARLAEELRRGLCDSAEAPARRRKFNLGEGTEVLAAIWGAVARVRDVVTIQSAGSVRFQPTGPEGALPISLWAGGERASDDARSASPRADRVPMEGSLRGTRILVADDDPAVAWFLAGVLKGAGATVLEARDGRRALEQAQQHVPDLVISDILMPALDGFALCRALKRDVVLRDVPVILLSWKEDLLQRVRELGADADGYLRKEASASAVVQRVREVLRRRRRVAERIASGGEVRGRLDGLTTRTLLEIACASRPYSTLTVRDASYLYEVEILDGRPVRASRTASDGVFQRGSAVIASLLGVGDGRFVVSDMVDVTVQEALRPDLNGDLPSQLQPAIAHARAAQRLLFGEALVQVDRVELDMVRLSAYVNATPEPARGLLRALGQGASPRKLITDGRAAARLIEDVLADAAAHGAVIGVSNHYGEEMLFAGVQHELARLRGESVKPQALGSNTDDYEVEAGSLLAEALAVNPFADESMMSALPPPVELPRDEPMEALPEPTPSPVPPSGPRALVDMDADEEEIPMPLVTPSLTSAPVVAKADALPWDAYGEAVLAGASAFGGEEEELAAPIALIVPQAAAAPPVEAVAPLTPRAGSMPDAVAPHRERESIRPEDSLTVAPDVEIREREETAAPAPKPAPAAAAPEPEAVIEPTPTPSKLPPPPGLQPMLTLGSLTPPPVEDPAPMLERFTRRNATPKPTAVDPRPSERERIRETTPSPHPTAPRLPRPSAYLPTPKIIKKEPKFLMWTGFAVVGVAFALWARYTRDNQFVPEPGAEMAPAVAAAPLMPAAPGAEGAPTASPEAGSGELPGPAPVSARGLDGPPEAPAEDLPLPDGTEIKKNQGLMEVVCGKSDSVYIDGKLIGSGPVLRKALKAREEPYEIRVKLRGEERVRFVSVKKGRLARVRVAPPWAR